MIGLMFKDFLTLSNLEGRKTRTSRTRGLDKINENPDDWRLLNAYYNTDYNGKFNLDKREFFALFQCEKTGERTTLKFPYGGLGTELYGKETYRIAELANADDDDFYIGVEYKAGGYLHHKVNKETYLKYFEPNFSPCDIWKSPMMMPEWASRYHLIIEGIGIQRIQDISEEDCIKEGINDRSDLFNPYEPDFDLYFKDSFKRLWDSINHNWKDNLWSWFLYYRVEKK